MKFKLLIQLGLHTLVIVLGLGLGCGVTCAAQEPTFDWRPGTDESVRMDPADYHTGRVFKSGDQAGNVHVDIEAQEPVTVEMAPAEEWSEAIRHPELLPRITFRCIREHVVNMTYVCQVPQGRPMTLVLRDERDSERTAVTGFGANLDEHGTVRDFVSPNDIHLQYYRWACTENCSPPQYQWINQLKERDELKAEPKIYDGLAADRDSEPFSVKINSPVAMTVAIVPSRIADRSRGDQDSIDVAVRNGACAERGVRSASFECTFDLADGPLSLIATPESGSKFATNQKAEIEVVASKCVANCLTETDPGK